MQDDIPWDNVHRPKNVIGLTNVEAAARLQASGPNKLPERAADSPLKTFFRQFASPLIYLLLAAFAIDIGIWLWEGHSGWPIEAIAIGVILVLNAAFGAWQERKAEAALSELKRLAAPECWVLRDGKLQRLAVEVLVAGDIVRLSEGERIPADGLVRVNHSLLIDESILTGESYPVEKQLNAEVFAGTLVLRGGGMVEVTRTGASGAMGKLAHLLGSIETSKTPLEVRLIALGHRIAVAIVVVAAALVLAGTLLGGGGQFCSTFMLAVALAVAAVPEGLPAVLTLTLALGTQRMARRKAVVRRLAAVEALGSVTVIVTDKTGTLTENRMLVKDIVSDDKNKALVAAILANDAEPNSGVGDPIDAGLLAYARTCGLDPSALRASYEVVEHEPFDSKKKYMHVGAVQAGQREDYYKGAPEVLLDMVQFDAERRAVWDARILEFATQGYRLLALAYGNASGRPQWLGLALFWDPPRPEVPDAVAAAQRAGIRVLMVTGDHAVTAAAIAERVGIDAGRVLETKDIEAATPDELAAMIRDVSIFARVTPEQKLRIVEALKASGEVVAMTGDGVNDAPALKRADVGVAMGIRGSDVSREVADLILLDDNFATIVAAIEEGRNIFENIQKFVRFLFSTNLSEVLIVTLGVIAALILTKGEGVGLWMPLTAAQILWINLISDGMPVLALALDRNPGVMRRPPRPTNTSILDAPTLKFLVVAGSFMATVGLTLLWVGDGLGYDGQTTRSALFLFLGTGQLFFIYPARRVHGLPGKNPAVHLAVAAGVGLQIAAVYVPGLNVILGSTPLRGLDLIWIAALVGGTWLFAEIYARRLKSSNLDAQLDANHGN